MILFVSQRQHSLTVDISSFPNDKKSYSLPGVQNITCGYVAFNSLIDLEKSIPLIMTCNFISKPFDKLLNRL